MITSDATNKSRIPIDFENNSNASITQNNSISAPLNSVEEYVVYCIENNKIRNSSINDDGQIIIPCNFEIDGSKVNKNLDWSVVIAKSAKITNEAISDYNKLPLTIMGVYTNIQIPNSENFVKHNAHSRYKIENNKIIVEDTLRIPPMNNDVDMSNIHVNGKVFWYNENDVKLEHLPYAKSFYGINPNTIKTDDYDKIGVRAKAKGLGPTICKALSSKPSIKTPNETKSVFSFLSRDSA